MEEEVVISSSSVEAGIGCWDLRSSAEHLCYRSCASPSHDLVSVVGRFLASSQLRDSSSSSGSVLFWSWNKVEVKSFPAEAINPLACNSDGTYIVGGGVSGEMYLWKVATGRLLKKWHGHYRPVTCLVFSDDQIFDEERQQRAGHLYEYSFTGHALPVSDIVTSYGGCNGNMFFMLVVEMGRYTLHNSILNPHPTITITKTMVCISSVHYLLIKVRLYALWLLHWMDLNWLMDQRMAWFVCGTLKLIISFVFLNIRKAGLVNNILVIRQPAALYPRNVANNQAPMERRHVSLQPPLEKYTSIDEHSELNAFITSPRSNCEEATYTTVQSMNNQINEL